MGYKEFLKKIRYRLTAKLKNGYLGGGVEEMWKGVEIYPIVGTVNSVAIWIIVPIMIGYMGIII